MEWLVRSCVLKAREERYGQNEYPDHQHEGQGHGGHADRLQQGGYCGIGQWCDHGGQTGIGQGRCARAQEYAGQGNGTSEHYHVINFNIPIT